MNFVAQHVIVNILEKQTEISALELFFRKPSHQMEENKTELWH